MQSENSQSVEKHMCEHAYVYIICVYICTCIPVCIYVYMCVYTHTHIICAMRYQYMPITSTYISYITCIIYVGGYIDMHIHI